METKTPWSWCAAEGPARLAQQLDRDGYTLFGDAGALAACDDPVAYGEQLFGRRPVRFQKMLVAFDPGGNQKSMPKTMFAGALHNDCAQVGMPPQYQVMVCERQSGLGGETLILDLWPVLDRIRTEDPGLLHDLFTAPRALPSGHMTRYGLTWSLIRGNLVCQHPTRARNDPVGIRFQRFIDEATTVRFKCHPGQVYVNNNHRCLHGREAFNDPSRRFVRLLYWFDQPLPAPPDLLALAREGCEQLDRRVAREDALTRQVLGAASWREAPGQSARAQALLQQLRSPTNCDDWQGPGQRMLLAQEALLDAAWALGGEAGTSAPDFDRVHRLLREGLAPASNQ